ncbi:hypothetical protein BSKO_04636 [Bryopsis sp. KO-2023]|nr:hypothetical protein BSKO_04636 [Bryopsis sp. KO-2023]
MNMMPSIETQLGQQQATDPSMVEYSSEKLSFGSMAPYGYAKNNVNSSTSHPGARSPLKSFKSPYAGHAPTPYGTGFHAPVVSHLSGEMRDLSLESSSSPAHGAPRPSPFYGGGHYPTQMMYPPAAQYPPPAQYPMPVPAPPTREHPVKHQPRAGSYGPLSSRKGSTEEPLTFGTHKPEQQRRSSTPQRTSSGSSGKEICRYFLRTGTCGYGDKCRYDHPKSAHRPSLNTLGYPLREGECTCRFFVKNGWCGFGSTCKFHHPELPARPVPTPGMVPVPYPPMQYGNPPMYPMPPAGMYPPGVPESAPGVPPMPMQPGMYPYMMPNGMPPHMPPVPWSNVPPPMPQHSSRRKRSSKEHSRDPSASSGSDMSTSSVLSGGQDGQLQREDSIGGSEVPL